MSKTIWRLKILFLCMAITVLFSQCSWINKIRGKEPAEKTPAELMSDGQENMDKGYFKDAAENFQMVKERYPYSQFATAAELKMADALFIQKEYEQAYDAYAEYEKMHPKAKEIPYIIFQRGMSHFNQIKTFDRDQSHSLQAKEEFGRLIRLFPQDVHARQAEKRVQECLLFLSKYELYVGHYYFKKGIYKAALGRYRYLIDHYPDMGQYQEALEYIALCEQKIREEK